VEEGGSDFITLHARTIPDGMNRQARWEYIGAVKDRLSIPVVGNGDVRRPEDALEMMRRTGCDGVMIGRQALIQPWIFRDVKALMAGSGMEKAPDLEGVLLNLLGLMSGHFPQDVAMKRFRAAVPWLAQNLAFGHHLGKEACRAKDAGQAAGTIRAIFARGIS
jgi:tRNA-dihydrouridine synthase B